MFKDNILIDKKTESLVKEYIPDAHTLRAMADYFSTLSDSTRIKILSALSISSMCVNDLSNLLEINQTTLSHQLKMLRISGFVEFKRQGKISFYYIKNNQILDTMLAAVEAM